jgi:2-desacetyl-2-hydroxyethyl bacteriochlorophyllide A dehydrogenase
VKVAVLHAPLDIRIDEVPRPEVGPGDLLVKVASAGICGTDLHFRHMGPRFAGKPMPLGHEWAGEVIEVGADVTRFKVGERVAYNSNNSPADMGRGGECGGFSNYVVLRDVDNHARSLCRLPDNVSYDHAALVEPISVGTHAVNRANPQPGETIALFGAGPIGLGIIMTLAGRRFDDVVVFDLSPLRRELAMKVGARAAYDPRENSPEQVLGELRGHGAIWGVPHPRTDIYIEASGAPGLLADICRFCNKGSRIITVAVHRQPLTLDGTKIMSKEITLIGSQGYPTEFPEVMTKIASGEIAPESMISHRFPFEQFKEAFQVADNAGQAAKVVLQFN